MENESLLEKKIYDRFIAAGWKVQLENRFPIALSHNQFYVPDLVLCDNEGSKIGFVEIIVSRNRITLQRIERIENAIKMNKFPLAIITNSFLYDIYINGEYIIRTHVCPTMEAYQFLLEHPETIKKELN